MIKRKRRVRTNEPEHLDDDSSKLRWETQEKKQIYGTHSLNNKVQKG